MVDREYLKDSVIMAAVAFGFVFFSTLAGIQVTNIRADPTQAVLAAVIAGGGSFFMFLAGRILPGPPIAKPPAALPP